MTVELYENRNQGYWIIKDGDAELKLSEKQFKQMREDGRSPLLKKLWDQAKKEREQGR